MFIGIMYININHNATYLDFFYIYTRKIILYFHYIYFTPYFMIVKFYFIVADVAFEIPDHFVVGYNFDFNEHFRNLKVIKQFHTMKININVFHLISVFSLNEKMLFRWKAFACLLLSLKSQHVEPKDGSKCWTSSRSVDSFLQLGTYTLLTHFCKCYVNVNLHLQIIVCWKKKIITFPVTLDADQNLIMLVVPKNIPSRFSRNSEANASEF